MWHPNVVIVSNPVLVLEGMYEVCMSNAKHSPAFSTSSSLSRVARRVLISASDGRSVGVNWTMGDGDSCESLLSEEDASGTTSPIAFSAGTPSTSLVVADSVHGDSDAVGTTAGVVTAVLVVGEDTYREDEYWPAISFLSKLSAVSPSELIAYVEFNRDANINSIIKTAKSKILYTYSEEDSLALNSVQ